MKRGITPFILIGLVACVAAGAWVFKNSLDTGNSASFSESASTSFSENSPVQSLVPLLKGSDTLVDAQTSEQTLSAGQEQRPLDSFELELIAKLQSSYDQSIDQLHIQASLIQVKAFMMERYPGEGAIRFERVIREAFPDFSEAILMLIARLEQYNEWFASKQNELSTLSFEAQSAAIWDQRRALFGDDADLIWVQEKAELAGRGNTIKAYIDDLDQNSSMSLDEKLYQLQATLAEQQLGSVQGMVTSPSTVVQAFFSLQSVQTSLENLAPQERQEQINNIRRQSGFSEQRIEELAAQDAKKDERWNKGVAYMAQRESLSQTLEGEALQSALSDLRVEYFEHEAITIEREEADDFWRFKRPRIYGVN